MNTSNDVRECHIEGVLHLPAPLFVEPNALGKTYDVMIGDVQCALTFPSLTRDLEREHGGRITAPEPLDPQRVDTLNKFRWGYVSLPTTLHSYVESALIRFSLDCPIQAVDSADQTMGVNLLDHATFLGMNAAVARWFDIVSEWLEVWTGQHIDPLPDPATHSTRVHAWEVGSVGQQFYGTGVRLGNISVQRSDTSASERTLRSAFDKASQDASLPIAHRMLRSAHSSQQRGDARIAVIDAATGAEVALSREIHTLLAPLAPDAVECILRLASGLVDLIRLRESLTSVEFPVSKNMAMHRLAEPRNKAAHAGVVPDRQATEEALSVAGAIISACSPLPSP